MRISKEILEVLSDDEINKLVKFYGTDLFQGYIKQLKKKYMKIYNFLDENDFEGDDTA